MRRKATFYPVAASRQRKNRDSRKKERAGSVMSEDSLLERVTAAAEERHLSHNSLLLSANLAQNHRVGGARRPRSRNPALGKGGEFYEEATRGRSASHHLQVPRDLLGAQG